MRKNCVDGMGFKAVLGKCRFEILVRILWSHFLVKSNDEFSGQRFRGLPRKNCLRNSPKGNSHGRSLDRSHDMTSGPCREDQMNFMPLNL